MKTHLNCGNETSFEIIAVMNATLAVTKGKSEKFRLVRDSDPCPLVFVTAKVL